MSVVMVNNMNNNVLEKLAKEKIYTRKEIFFILAEDKDEYTYNSFNWELKGMLDNGILSRIGRNTYKVGTISKKSYQPRYTYVTERIIEFMENSYADIEYSVFETVMLNEFLNHQIARNTYFLYVEKELSEFVFRDLKKEIQNVVLYNPTKEDLQRYWEKDVVIVLNRISEAPIGKGNRYDTPLEKMFVDIISDKALLSLYSKGEYPEMLSNAIEKYVIDFSRLFRYARRRGKQQEIKKAMESGGLKIDNT